MGFFKTVSAWWTARHAENDARAATARRIVELMDMQREDDQDDWQKVVESQMTGNRRSGTLREDSSIVINTKADGAGWEILGSAWKGHIARDQQVMVAQARRFFRFDPNAQAAIYGLLDYLMGRGVTITPKSQDARIWKLWRNFWTSPENNMDIRQFEIFKRIFRDGETFLRYFTTDKSGGKTPFTTIRFMDPIDVQRGASEKNAETDKTNQGITFDPDDAEKPVMYHMKDRINPGIEHAIPAAEVQHIKYPVADMDQSRGESALQAVMELFTHYKQWLKNRIILNKLRTAIFAVRKIDIQSGASVSQLQQTLPSSGRSQDGKKQNIRPGTLYNPPPGVDIEMRSANINASDVKEDGRNMILQMCAGTRLPEFMFGDASNANYSSTMMAESPFVKHIHFLQAYFEATVWRPMFRKVVEAAVASGKLIPPKEDDIFAQEGQADLTEAAQPDDKTAQGRQKPPVGGDKGTEDVTGKNVKEKTGKPFTESELEVFYGCDVQWPEIIHREPKEQTEALVLARDAGWLSDKTASEMLGFDWSEEVRKQQMIEQEAELEGNPLLQRSAGALALNDEEQKGLNQQDQELAAAGAGKSKKPPFGKNGSGGGE